MSRNNDYATGNLLDYEYFKDHYQLIAIDLRKQTEFKNFDLKQQINFIDRLEREVGATVFYIIEKKKKKPLLISHKILRMESQKIANLLNGSDNESSQFATRKWYVINYQNNGEYDEEEENGSTIKFEAKVIKPFLCDDSDAYVLVTGNITATGGNAYTRVAFKNCAPFTTCVTQIDDEHVETAENLDIIMLMYSLIEYSDNYADTSGSLW